MLWALFTASVLFAFVIVLISVVIAERHGLSLPWIYSGIAAATLIVALSEHFRTDLAFLTRQTSRAWALAMKLRLRTKSDFLYLHTLTTYALVLGPALLAALLLGIYSTGLARPGTASYVAYADVLKQLTTLAGTLLIAQIALFNFMFGQLLGKYSSAIAVSVSQHRVVRLLRGYSIVLLIALYGFYLLGFPESLPKVAFLLALSLAASVGITVWASNTGIRVDLAILYSGHHSAERVARSIRPPILARSRFWNSMAALGLDWRSPERMVVTLPPEEPSSASTTFASGLFNAAHKSIQENQHETFWSSLLALSLIVEAYVKRRRQYFGSTDHFLDYLNDQLAALGKAAAKSPNEYMVMNVVTFIGIIGAQALEVGRGPNPPKAKYPESHPYFSHWQGLLGECFDLTHGLMRTTAASEVLKQLSKLTKKAVDLGYGDDASMSFPAELKRIYAMCLGNRSPYHLSLAGQCVTAAMEVWSYSLSRHEAVIAGVSGAMCEAVKQMALDFQRVEKLPSFDLKDPATTLTSKFSEEHITLQDIALSILTRPVKERWQRSSAVADFRELLNLASELLKDAAAKDLSFAKQYGDAFYELALLIFVGLPSQWYEPAHPAEKYSNINRPTVQGLFESKLAQTIKELIPLYHRARRMVHDWDHKLFSLIGMAAAIYSETGRESARLLAVEAILCYRDLIADSLSKNESVADQAWDYLQLTSVWVRHLLKDVDLADSFVEAVANGRPYRFGILESSGKQGWGSYGYPNVSFLNSDFFLSYPQNIGHRLSETVSQMLKRWQDCLMNPDELRDTYERIEKIRELVLKRIVEQRDREKEKP
jgi:hypothetical protein